MLEWHGCYDGSWRGLIAKKSFAHPAKFAPNLVRRVYDYGLAAGWWAKGDLIGDPFGGVAGGGILAGYAGLSWVGVELEPRFVEWGNENLAMHGPKWKALGGVSSVKLVQGDSRRFAEIVAGAAGIVTSPPYGDSSERCGTDPHPERAEGTMGRGQLRHGYGGAGGQIGALPAGDLAGVVTSPPYVSGGHHADQTGAWGGIAGEKQNHSKDVAGYGKESGQIGQLREGDLAGVVTSPPYAESLQAVSDKKAESIKRAQMKYDRAQGHPGRYEMTPGANGMGGDYGQADGQIGLLKLGETYWQAMHAVYGQCRLALRPGGVMAVVVKDYVRNGERVPLCDQTAALLVHLGFRPLETIRAMMVRERVHAGLFGDTTERRDRKSFFRRLSERKGSPRIDWEEVLVVRRSV